MKDKVLFKTCRFCNGNNIMELKHKNMYPRHTDASSMFPSTPVPYKACSLWGNGDSAKRGSTIHQ